MSEPNCCKFVSLYFNSAKKKQLELLRASGIWLKNRSRWGQIFVKLFVKGCVSICAVCPCVRAVLDTLEENWEILKECSRNYIYWVWEAGFLTSNMFYRNLFRALSWRTFSASCLLVHFPVHSWREQTWHITAWNDFQSQSRSAAMPWLQSNLAHF